MSHTYGYQQRESDIQITFDLHHMRDHDVITLGNAIADMIDKAVPQSDRWQLLWGQHRAVCVELQVSRGIEFDAHVRCPPKRAPMRVAIRKDYQMADMTIRTNHVPRDIIHWWDLTAKEQAEFDWLDTDDKRDESDFIRYRGAVYCLSEFSRCDFAPQCGGYHGYHGDSYFSGVLIKYVDNFERVIAATYMS